MCVKTQNSERIQIENFLIDFILNICSLEVRLIHQVVFQSLHKLRIHYHHQRSTLPPGETTWKEPCQCLPTCYQRMHSKKIIFHPLWCYHPLSKEQRDLKAMFMLLSFSPTPITYYQVVKNSTVCISHLSNVIKLPLLLCYIEFVNQIICYLSS